MYELPLKRAGATFNRMIYSNSRIIAPCMGIDMNKFYKINLTYKTYANGKEAERKYLSEESDMDFYFNGKKE